MIDYLAVGHIARDLLGDGGVAFGGTAHYAATVAARFGLRAAVLSAGDPAHLTVSTPGVTVVAPPCTVVTTFENRYEASGRRQVLHAVAPPVDLTAAPVAWRDTPLFHLAPVAAEIDLHAVLDWVSSAALVGATPQGWMRAWGASLPATVRPVPWRPAPALLRRMHLIVLSIEDLGGDEEVAAAYAAHCPLVAVTRGAAGATLYIDGTPHAIAPFPAREVDPTGAGDVFAAAMLARLHMRDDPRAAAVFASAAAALSVEGPGLGRLTGHAVVEALLSSVC